MNAFPQHNVGSVVKIKSDIILFFPIIKHKRKRRLIICKPHAVNCGRFCFWRRQYVFLFVYEISREPLNGLAPNSQRRRVRSLARKNLKVKVKDQRLRTPGTKNGIFSALSAVCVRFMFGKTYLASSFCAAVWRNKSS